MTGAAGSPAESGATLCRQLRRVMITAGPDESRPLDAAGLASRAERGAASSILLRQKELPDAALLDLATRLVAVTRIPVLVSQRPRIAARSGARGVHLGAGDGSVAAARQELPAGSLVGVSVHSVAEARAREAEGADYLMFGPVRPTVKGGCEIGGVGLAALAQVCAAVSVPVLAVGGLEAEDEVPVREVGAVGWAAIRAYRIGAEA